MHIYYTGFWRIPTEKAHGLTVVKSCEALAKEGAQVTLVLPRRINNASDDVFVAYNVERNFNVRFLPVLDLLSLSSSRIAFWVSYSSFFVSAFLYFLFARKDGLVLYTRDAPLLLFSLFGVPVFYECHHIFSRSSVYFALVRLARGVITISRALKNSFLDKGFSEENILVAPSGFDIAIFSHVVQKEEARRELELPLNAFLGVYTGNFTTMGEDKGISDILKTLKVAPEITFVAVGGSDTDRRRYQNEANDLGVESQVILRGYAPQKTLALYQCAADALLMPFPDTPHYRSNMSPVKMFEYMAGGRPIVASNLSTITEVLNRENALLVPPDSPHEIAQALKRLLSDPVLGERLANKAKEDVLTFSWSDRSRRVLAFLNKYFLVK